MKKHYYLYIDDSGSRFPDKQDSVCRADGMDHFALGGILVSENDKDVLKEKYEEFCKKWSITYPLHSTKIRGMRANFTWLVKNSKRKKNFFQDLELFLTSIPVIGFAAVVNRPGYNNRYKEKYENKPWWMCKTAYSILIERVSKYVQDLDGDFKVRFEQGGKKEDRAILEYAKSMKVKGLPFNPNTSGKYKALVGNDFKSLIVGEPRRRKKENLFIQIADLYLYPMIKRKHDPNYPPWLSLHKHGKVIDAYLPDCDLEHKGIKYSCFDD